MEINSYKTGMASLAVFGIMTSMYLLSTQSFRMTIKGLDGKDMRDIERSDSTITNFVDHYQYAVTDEDFIEMQEERIRHLKEVCTDRELFYNRTYKGRPNTVIYISKDYNFSYCKVPKCGCSFWTQVFLLLSGQPPKDVFSLQRSSVHGKTAMFSVPYDQLKYTNPRMVLVSRDPYSRLYSAFIDKYYLGLYPNLRQVLGGGNGDMCNFEGSFESFIQYIVNEAKSNKTLDRHWAPIYSICQPCGVNQWRLVKQETFSTDVALVLEELNIEEGKYQVINDTLHRKRAETTLPGMIATYFSTNRRQRAVHSCLRGQGVAERVWTSLQVQGFIDERVPLPKERFISEMDYWNETLLTELVLETIQEHPLSLLEAKQQRYRALVNVYKTVSEDSINGIQDVYKQDFALYGYDTYPPTMNDEGLPRGY